MSMMLLVHGKSTLKWQGNHEISDFDLARLGDVLRSGAETEHTGYVIIKSHSNILPVTHQVAGLSQDRWHGRHRLRPY
jgi:hypothetical protein